MPRLLVWDLPVRLFHLLLGLGFIAAFMLANVVSSRDVLFSGHMIIGLVMGFMVLLRIVWGFVGTRHARFRDFVHGPRAVLSYLGGALRGDAPRHAGHNPGSSADIFLILALVLGLATTGIMMGRGDKSVEGLHSVLAWVLFGAVVLHIIGVVMHHIRNKENITLTMIDGLKEVEPAEAIPSARPIIGIAFIVLVALSAGTLVAGFDATTRQLSLPGIGQALKLGKTASEGRPRPPTEPAPVP